MKVFRLFMVLLIAFSLGLGSPEALFAAKSVEERLVELEQEMKLLRRQLEVEKEIKVKKETETPVLAVGQDGINVKSKDGAFQLKFRGQVQGDARFFANDNTSAGANTFLMRRVRPTLEGTVFKHFDFRLMPDFGGGNTVLQDAWVDFKYWKQAQVRVGKFKSPIGLERLQSDPSAQFVETALSTNLVPNRDLGVDLHGDLGDGILSYDLGVFNGVTDNGSWDTDIHDDKEFVGRIFSHPFKNADNDYLNGFGIGIGGSAGSSHGATLPTFRSGGQQSIFTYSPATGTVLADGPRLRLAPQAYYYYGPFGFLSEFVFSSQEVVKGVSSEKIDNRGWQIAANYVITGENASYGGVIPRYAFDPRNGKWGALELAARFSSLKIDDDAFPIYANPLTAVKSAKAWDIGLNWYLNRNVKVMTHFEETFFDGGSVTGGDRKAEHALLSRLQLYI